MEHRHSPRTLATSTVYLENRDGSAQYGARVVDISAHGMRVQLENTGPALNSILQALLSVAGSGQQPLQRLPMLVVHKAGNQLGLYLLGEQCRFDVNSFNVQRVRCQVSH